MKVIASDLGGARGYGPVEPEAEEPTFHGRWESRVLALTLAMGATRSWTLDQSRFAREDRPRHEYVSTRYYDLWFRALRRLLLESALVTRGEVESGVVSVPGTPIRRLEAANVDEELSTGSRVDREPRTTARFTLGDSVTTTNTEPSGHTRLPMYARGKDGRIAAVHGAHVFPDTNVHGRGEEPQWLYTVEFDARELFGAEADRRSVVSIDAVEPYLEAR